MKRRLADGLMRVTLARALVGLSRLLPVFLLPLLVSFQPAAAAQIVATVTQPRAFGHTIGDVLTQRVLLGASGHDALDAPMPSSGGIGIWFERRAPRVEPDDQGRRWLVLDYQLTNAPRTLTQTVLPSLALHTRAGDVLQVREWPISIGPLAPDMALGTGGLSALQPDRAAPNADYAAIKRRLSFSVGCLAATLAVWFGWWFWRNRREAARLPFASAWQQMRRLAAENDSAGDGAALWRIVHRALNETAGHVVHSHTLPRLFSHAPWLQPLRPQLEQFYQLSESRFFACVSESQAQVDSHADCHANASRDDAAMRGLLVSLTRALYRAERSHR
ncbi:calcium incorporation protein MxaA [Trinickia sp. LjRoot230]|uniref:calcium incorporation protein MxaA n=1 Tax=Trinickia sp. LjRoot230 TaxID=3342288 RepID=UPI003ECD7F62